MNKEVVNLGQALRFLTSAEVLYVPGRPNSAPEGVKVYTPRAGTEFIQNVTIRDKGAGKDVLLGIFRDDDGGWYFMPVNLQRHKEKDAEALRLTVEITLAPSVQSLTQLSRSTGKAETVAVTDGKLELTLPGGTGELFKIGEGDFAGLGERE